MFIRVWEYDVPEDTVARFVAAYGPSGDWAALFARSSGFVRTELFRNTQVATRFVSLDVWSSQAAWRSFLDRWGEAYAELDVELEMLAAGGRLLVEGSAGVGD
ncbi:MAG TPA: antibiotic biosynthesis monooxygenase [Jiangellaceae bacterium]|jgi:heme-degrading monooxygenase HmoA